MGLIAFATAVGTAIDASKIGVQAGGLKMPPGAKKSAEPVPVTTVKDPALQGWIARNAKITSDSKRIMIKSSGRHSFLATNQVRSEGATKVRLHRARNTLRRLLPATEEAEIFHLDEHRGPDELGRASGE